LGWVRPKAAAAMLGCGMTTLYEMLKDGRLESRKTGNLRLITVRSIRAIGDDEPRAAA
jgi:excisionase family DNA binding protein